MTIGPTRLGMPRGEVERDVAAQAVADDDGLFEMLQLDVPRELLGDGGQHRPGLRAGTPANPASVRTWQVY